jgi:hypothetical protein
MNKKYCFSVMLNDGASYTLIMLTVHITRKNTEMRLSNLELYYQYFRSKPNLDYLTMTFKGLTHLSSTVSH